MVQEPYAMVQDTTTEQAFTITLDPSNFTTLDRPFTIDLSPTAPTLEESPASPSDQPSPTLLSPSPTIPDPLSPSKEPPLENSEFNACYTCDPDGECYAVDPSTVYTVQEYGYVESVESMQSEMFARGPIACSMFVDAAFQDYSGGILSSPVDESEDSEVDADYMVSLVGWGYDE